MSAKWKRAGGSQPVVADEDTRDDRVLPHSLDAERSVLGAILVDSEAWPHASAEVDTEDFFRAAHRLIYDQLRELALSGAPMDVLLLSDAMKAAGTLEDAGGPAYLAALLDGVPRATNVKHYAMVVREKSRLRQTIRLAAATLGEAYDGSRPAAAIVDDAVRGLLTMASASTGSVLKLDEATHRYVENLDADRGDVIATGLVDVDSLIGGFERKHLSILAARPSVGKTSLISCILDNVAARGAPTGFITVEMQPEAIAGNLLSVHSGVSSSRFRRKEQITEQQWGDILGAVESVADRPFYLVRDVQTITHVASWTRRLREQYGVRLVAVDYLQLLADPKAHDRQQEVAMISRSLKRIAEAEDVAMVALAMVGRGAEKRQDSRPTLADLRESGAIEADADLALLLYREEMHKPKDENHGIAEVIVAKNRTGPVGTVRVAFVKETTRWANLAPTFGNQ